MYSTQYDAPYVCWAVLGAWNTAMGKTDSIHIPSGTKRRITKQAATVPKEIMRYKGLRSDSREVKFRDEGQGMLF